MHTLLYLLATLCASCHRRPQIVAAGNEDADAADEAAGNTAINPADVMLCDERGRSLETAEDRAMQPVANSELSARGQMAMAGAGNAASSLATSIAQRLTTYAAGYMGYPGLMELVNFLAPAVPVPMVFNFVTDTLANAFASVQDDAMGTTGKPALVTMDDQSDASYTLKWRGLEIMINGYQRQIAAAMPGNSEERELQRRARFLIRALQRGMAQRVIALAAASAGAATGRTWAAGTNPISDATHGLEQDIETVADLAGGREFVRVLFGSQAYLYLKDHVLVTGEGQGPLMRPDLGRLAELLELPQENLKVTHHQALSTKQGVTAAKARLLTNTNIYVFACMPNPTEDDPSWLKRFVLDDGSGGSVENYYVEPIRTNPRIDHVGVAYFELPMQTLAGAGKRLNIATS